MEVLGDGQGNALYPARHELMGKTYGTDRLLMGNGGMTHGGWFSQGFGTIPEKYKPALLWSYNTFAAAEDQNRFDTLNYPHRAIMALVNWPIGLKAEYPFTDRRRRIHAGLAGRILDRSKAGTPHVPAEQRQRARHAGLPEHGRSRGGRRRHGPAPRRRGPRRRPRAPARPLAPTWSLPDGGAVYLQEYDGTTWTTTDSMSIGSIDYEKVRLNVVLNHPDSGQKVRIACDDVYIDDMKVYTVPR